MATTPPKLTPQQQRTVAAKAAAQRQAAAEQAKSTALQNEARKIANSNKLYSYTQPTKEDLAKAERIKQSYDPRYVFNNGMPAGYGNSPAPVIGKGGMPPEVAKQYKELTSPKLVTNTSYTNPNIQALDNLNDPALRGLVRAMQQDDVTRAEQRGRNYQTAADGTVYDLNDPASKKEYDENNAYWQSMGGYHGVKKGGVIKKKPAKASKPTKRYAAGGAISSASKRGDGCASKGKTRCKIR